MTLAYEPPVEPAVADGDSAVGSLACAGCAAPLAVDQRYCVGCGLRCAPDELRLAALPVAAELAPLGAPGVLAGRERPFARSAAVTAVVVLSLGVGIGATIGPAAVGETAAAQRPLIVLASAPAAAAAIAPALSAPLDDLVPPDTSSAVSPADGADAGSTDAPTAPAASDPTTGDDPSAAAPDDDGQAPNDDDPASPADIVPPGSKALAGVVVAVGAAGEGFTLADRSGALLAIHASGCDVAPGDDLHLRARKLANGTWAADRVRRVRGGLTTVRAVGVVSWVDPAGGRYALAARGATLLVTVAPADPATVDRAPADPATAEPTADPEAADPATPEPTADPTASDPTASDPTADPAATVSPPLPVVGERLRVQIGLRVADAATPPALLERGRTVLPSEDPASTPVLAPLEFDGTIVTIDQQARTVVLALDASTPPTATVVLSVPSTFDLADLLPAQRIAVTAEQQGPDAYAMTGFSGDDAAEAPPVGCTVLAKITRSSVR